MHLISIILIVMEIAAIVHNNNNNKYNTINSNNIGHRIRVLLPSKFNSLTPPNNIVVII